MQKDVFRDLLLSRLIVNTPGSAYPESINALSSGVSKLRLSSEMARIALRDKREIVFHHATKRRRSFLCFDPTLTA
jgi:hypothetical protein